ncbi:hypothetical protein [Pseudomonas sp. NFPP28]|uniref:DUF7673 family protein n=1 Tax=Pseudomonas sp. NFPP28 TaxID=1566231 RepID=UPI0008E58BE6|nr:hypothetical protein [Pseudomonas sp. NFPP28]SFP27732.1 hypothetical protein SAMN03159315_02573 [Pseudomonas sp. NFPP28]
MNDSLINALSQVWAYQRRRPAIIRSGTQALNRLIPIALSRTPAGNTVGHFLLGLYDGATFRFNLKHLHGLALSEFEDCIRVLEMDYMPEVEVHQRIDQGESVWKELMEVWRTQPQEYVGHRLANQRNAALCPQRSREIKTDGIRAFDNLIHVVEASTGQSLIAGLFLMSLIHPHHYRLNLTDLRGLDLRLFEDCLSLLRMDYFTHAEGRTP